MGKNRKMPLIGHLSKKHMKEESQNDKVDALEMLDPIDKAADDGKMSKIATDLLTHLGRIREDRQGIPARRWIWELIQNAVDCATSDSLKVEFEYKKSERSFIFRHDGKAFEDREIVALIQAWSTKLGDETKEGKFAEGFIQSHAVSENIVIQGNLGEKQSFRFELNRTGKNIKEIIDGLDNAIKELKSSRSPQRKEWHAQFEYRDLDEKALSIIDRNLKDFKRTAPLVLALSPRLLEIRVISEDESEHWKKGKEQNVDGLKLWSVLRNDSLDFIVAAMTIENARIVALGTYDGGKCFLEDLREVPKLFRRYPLWSTKEFGLPVIVDYSFNVYPDRSGPTFDSGDKSQYNKDILKDALEHIPNFLKLLLDNDWKNLELAARVSTPQVREGELAGKDFSFLSEPLKKLVIGEPNRLGLSNMPLVPIEGSDSQMPASQSIIPYMGDAPLEGDTWEPLWKLLRGLNPQKVVKRNSALLWAGVQKGWSEVSKEDYSKFGGRAVLDVVEEVKNVGDLATLSKRLQSDENRVLDFLKLLYQEIIRTGKSLKDLGILPNEFGTFVQEVYTDPGVDPELLEIARELGFSPSDKLLHTKVAELEGFKWNETLKPLDVAGLEGRILQKIQNEADKKSILVPSARFLRWLIRQGNRTEMIKAFPFVFVSETKETKGKIEKPYFVPQSRWHQDARRYYRLFDIATLADEYDEMYVFGWNKVPGDDEEKLRSFLEKFNIEWVKEATIEKIDDNKIQLSSGENSLEICLSNDKAKTIMRLNTRTLCELEVKEEKGELNTYDKILEDSGWEVLKKLEIVTSSFIIDKTLDLTSQEEREYLLYSEKPVDTKSCNLQKSRWVVKELPNLGYICRVRVRESRDNSLDFITFLLEHLAHVDDSWKSSPEEIVCNKHNQSHKFTRCYWLALLRNHYQWVWEAPNQAGKPSAQNLKNVVRGASKPELIKALKSQENRELLNLLGLPHHELALAVGARSVDEERLLGSKIFEIVQPLQPDALDNLAKLAQERPNDLVSALKTMTDRAQLIRDNQALGEKVEDIIKRLLQNKEKEGRKLVVDGVHVGADKVVKVVHPDPEKGVTIELAKYLLEIKSTHTDHVRDLTPEQVKKAMDRENRETYFLCIFPLSPEEKPEDVEDADALKRIKVVSRVADHLEPRYREVQEVKDATSGEKVWVENLYNLRYAIKKEVWESAPNLEQWINQILSS